MKLSDLKAHPRNPRKISEASLTGLQGSLEEFGDLGCIVFNKGTGRLISGHQRTKCLPPESQITIEHRCDPHPVTGTTATGFVMIKGERFAYREVSWPETKEKAAMIAANRHGGIWEATPLAELLLELDQENYDMKLTGFDEAALESLAAPTHEINAMAGDGSAYETPIVEDPRAEEVPETAPKRVTLGDVWQLGRHRLMCGDSTDELRLVSILLDREVDMVFTDPPYGVSYTGGHNEKKRGGIKGDTLSGEDLTSLFFKAIGNCIRVAAPHAAFYIWYANGKAVETFQAIGMLPLKIRAVICWYKVRSGLGAFMSQYIPNYEPCIYAHIDGKSPQWFGPTDEKTVWELQRSGPNEFHPTQKPVDLAQRAILNSSKEDDLVLDVFGGSGSTLIACEKTNRECLMMELDPIYCDVILKRWEDYTGQKAMKL